nr:hypothetical protein [Streptomyces sp. SID5464]
MRDGKQHLILTPQQRGTALKEQDGREARIGPGDFSLSDSSRLFRKTVPSDFAFTSFHFPRTDLRVRDEDLRAVTATAFSGQEGSAALVATYFARLAREAPSLRRRPPRPPSCASRTTSCATSPTRACHRPTSPPRISCRSAICTNCSSSSA